jgi:hypothetical protein
MGTISNPRISYGLIATGTPTKTQVANTVEIGVASTPLSLTGANVAYCISASLASVGDLLAVDTETGATTIGTTPVAQVETATVVAASGATSSGNLAVTVTAARVTGSPLAFSVALVNGVDTTATLIAAKIRTAFNANSALTAVYTVGGTGADVTLTETDPENNDATLNIAIAAGLGVSAIVSSTNTTAGVGGVKLTNSTGDGNDFEGVALPAVSGVYGFMVKNTSSAAFLTVSNTGTDLAISNIAPGGLALLYLVDGAYDSNIEFEYASGFGGSLTFELTIIGIV